MLFKCNECGNKWEITGTSSEGVTVKAEDVAWCPACECELELVTASEASPPEEAA
jgi:hypothetical protein